MGSSGNLRITPGIRSGARSYSPIPRRPGRAGYPPLNARLRMRWALLASALLSNAR